MKAIDTNIVVRFLTGENHAANHHRLQCDRAGIPSLKQFRVGNRTGTAAAHMGLRDKTLCRRANCAFVSQACRYAGIPRNIEVNWTRQMVWILQGAIASWSRSQCDGFLTFDRKFIRRNADNGTGGGFRTQLKR